MLNLDPGIFFLQWAINSQCRNSAGEECQKNILSTQPQTQHLYQPLPSRFWEYHRKVGKSQGKEGCPFSSGHNKTISLLNSEQLPAEDQARQNSVIAGIGDLQPCPLPRRYWQLVVAGEGRNIVFWRI